MPDAIEIVRALNLASRGHSRTKPRYGRVYTAGGPSWTGARVAGVTVFAGQPNLPYGWSNATRAYLSHIPTTVYTAWLRGLLRGQMARWLCGRTSRDFTLDKQPCGRLCHLCAMYAGGRQHGVVVTIWSAA